MNFDFLSVAGDIKAGGGGGLPVWLPTGRPVRGGPGEAWAVPWAGGRFRSLRAFSAPWRGLAPLPARLPGWLEELGLRKCLESLLCCAGGGAESQKDAGACQTPPPTPHSPTARTERPGDPAPQEEEVPSFLPGEFHWAVSETALSPSPSFWWTMALCTSFPPSHSPLHTKRWGLRGRGT